MIFARIAHSSFLSLSISTIVAKASVTGTKTCTSGKCPAVQALAALITGVSTILESGRKLHTVAPASRKTRAASTAVTVEIATIPSVPEATFPREFRRDPT